MDRIDLVCNVWRPDPTLLVRGGRGVSSASLRDAVSVARLRAERRGLGATSRLSGAALLAACRMTTDASAAFEVMARARHLSGRGVTRLLRVARTFADMNGSDRVTEDDLAEALSYRGVAGG